MYDLTLQTWREDHIVIQPNKETPYPFFDSEPNYINIYNYSNNQIFVSRSPGVSPTNYDFAVPPLSNRQWGWARGTTSIYLYQAGQTTSPIKITSYQAQFNPASVVQSGQNVIVAQALDISSMPKVTINGTVPTTVSNVLHVVVDSSNMDGVISGLNSAIAALSLEIADLKGAVDNLTTAINTKFP